MFVIVLRFVRLMYVILDGSTPPAPCLTLDKSIFQTPQLLVKSCSIPLLPNHRPFTYEYVLQLSIRHHTPQSLQGRVSTPVALPSMNRLERKAVETYPPVSYTFIVIFLITQRFVTRYYDVDNRMLNLSNLSAYLPDLTSVNFNNSTFVSQLIDVMVARCPDVCEKYFPWQNVTM